MKRFAPISLCIMSLFVVACEVEGERFSLLAYDIESDEYAIQTVEINTLEDVGKLKGSVTELRAHADITVDWVNLQHNLNIDDYPVDFRAVKQNGVLIPEDFDSLAMATTYYNLEISEEFFVQIGMPRDLVGPIPTYYHARMKVIAPEYTTQMKDNALYVRYVLGSEIRRGFFIFPFEILQWIPIAINSGVITHEYTHAVFDQVIGMKINDLETYWHQSGDYYSKNMMDSLNEGFSDAMAVARTGDPDYMAHSIPVGYPPNAPDLSRQAQLEIAYSETVDQAAYEFDPVKFDAYKYEVAEFVSALFYGYAMKLDQKQGDEIPDQETRYRVAENLYDSIVKMGEDLEVEQIDGIDDSFGLWKLFNLYAGRYIVEEEGEKAICADGTVFCELLSERYQLYYNAQKVPNCYVVLSTDC